MNDYLADYIMRKLGNELDQVDIEEILMATELSDVLETEMLIKEMEIDAPVFNKHEAFKPHTVPERRRADRKHKETDWHRKDYDNSWNQYFAGRTFYGMPSAKERRYAEAAKPIDDCTMQEAMETAEMEIRQHKHDELDDKYMEVNAEIANAYEQIRAIRERIQDLEFEKSNIIYAINSLYL